MDKVVLIVLLIPSFAAGKISETSTTCSDFSQGVRILVKLGHIHFKPGAPGYRLNSQSVAIPDGNLESGALAVTVRGFTDPAALRGKLIDDYLFRVDKSRLSPC